MQPEIFKKRASHRGTAEIGKSQWGRHAIVLALQLGLIAPAQAELQTLARLVPGDVIAFYTVDPPPGPQVPGTSNSLEIATVLIDQAFAMGFLKSLDPVIRGWLDAIACISTVIAHPHTVMLFDLQVQRDEQDSHRVSELRAAIVLQTGRNNKVIERRIQHLLDSYADQKESTLETANFGAHSLCKFSDTRLTDWLKLFWGPVGEYFVLAIGEESARAIVETINGGSASVWDDPNYRAAVEKLAAQQALITAQIRFDEVRKKSRALGTKLSRMQVDLGMADCEQGFWAAGYAGRSLEIRQWLNIRGVGHAAAISGEQFLGGSVRAALPGVANSFAAIGAEPSLWFERIRAAYLSARSRKNASESRAYWRGVEAEAGMRFADLFGALGDPILVHDYPVHALRLPPAWTIVVPVQRDAPALRKNIDALLSYWRAQLVQGPFGLSQTSDGIWFMNVGLEGPALKVTDRFLVFSFSPHAVRQNLERPEMGASNQVQGERK